MKQYQTLLALNISTFLMMLGVGLIVSILPQRLIDLSGSDASIGWLASAFAVSFVLLQVPVGHLADRMGYRMFLTLGYALAGLTGLIYYWSPNTLSLLLGRFVQGMGEIPIWSLAPALLAIQHPSHTGRSIGLYNASMHLGLTLGPLLGFFLGSFFPMNTAFLFFTVVCTLGAIISGRFVENPVASVKSIPVDDAGPVDGKFADGRTVTVLSGILLYGAGYGVYLTAIPAYLILAKGFSQAGISVYFTLCYLGISLSQVLAGHLSDTHGRRIFMVVGLLGAGICLAVFPNLDQPWTIPVLALGSLGLGVFNVASLALINQQTSDQRRGAASGVYFLALGLGYFLGPLGTSFLNHVWDLKAGFLALAGLIGVNALALIKKGSR